MPNLSLRPIVGNRRGGAAAPTPSEQVQAFLAGTAGWAISPDDVARLWTTFDKFLNVVNPADPIGAMDTIYGTTTYTYTQATAANRPAWDGIAAAVGDGVADFLEGFGAGLLALLNGPTDVTGAMRFELDDLAAVRGLWHFTTSGGTGARWSAEVLTTGALQLIYRFNDAAGATTLTSAAGVITAGTPVSLIVHSNYAGNLAKAWVNGVEVISAALGGTSSVGTSNRVFWGLAIAANRYAKGPVGRGLFAPKAPTADDRANISAWMEAVAI